MNINLVTKFVHRLFNRIKYESSKIIGLPFIASLTRSYLGNEWNPGPFRIDISSPLITNQNVSRMFWGFYESSERKLVCKHLHTERQVIELGGSLGVVSSLIATRLAPNASFIVIEANPKLIPLIKTNITLNRQDITLTVLNRAIAYTSGEVSFWFDPHTAGSAMIEAGNTDTPLIPTITLSNIVAMLNEDVYTLVADIEGAEIQMLLCDIESLAGCTKIIIELHNTHWNNQYFTINDLVSLFQKQGFFVIDSSENVYVFERRP